MIDESHNNAVVTVTVRKDDGLREVDATVPEHHERCSCGAWKYEDDQHGADIQPHCVSCHRIVQIGRQEFKVWEDYDPDVWSWWEYGSRALPRIGYSGHRACETCGKCAKDLPKPWGWARNEQRDHPLYCSAACRQKAYRDRPRDGHNDVVVTVTVPCANCQEPLGDEVWIDARGAWRCGTCAGSGYYPNVTVCEPCGRTIHTVNYYRRFCSATCRQRDSRGRKAARKAALERYTLAEG